MSTLSEHVSLFVAKYGASHSPLTLDHISSADTSVQQTITPETLCELLNENEKYLRAWCRWENVIWRLYAHVASHNEDEREAWLRAEQ